MDSIHLEICPIETISDTLHEIILKNQKNLDRITVVMPTTTSLRAIRRSVGKNGLFNVQFTTLSRIAADLSTSSLYDKELKPLSRPIKLAALRNITSEIEGPLSVFQNSKGFIDSLSTAFDEISSSSTNKLKEFLPYGNELTSTLFEAYESYIKKTSSYYDTNRLLNEAVSLVESNDLNEHGTFIFCLGWDYSASQTNLIRSLLNDKGGTVLLGTVGDSTDSIISDLIEILGIKIESHVTQQPFSNSTRLHMMLINDASEEIRQVIRDICSASANGIPFHDISIIYSQEFPYRQLIEDELSLADIPIFSPTGRRLRQTLPGKMLEGILGLAEGHFPRKEIMEWLSNCPVKLNSVTSSPAEWDSFTRIARVVHGIENWNERISSLIHQKQRALKDYDTSDVVFQHIQQEIYEITQMYTYILQLYEKLKHDNHKMWNTLVNWLLELFNFYLDKSKLSTKDLSVLEVIQEKVSELSALDNIEENVTFELFKESVLDILEANEGQVGKFGNGIFVGSPRMAVGMTFERSYITGVSEGRFPSSRANQPFLTDSFREASGGRKIGLITRDERDIIQRYEFIAVIRSSKECMLSSPRGDFKQQNVLHPSKWFLEIASELAGFQVNSKDWVNLANESWITSIPSKLASIRSLNPSGYTSIFEFDLAILDNWVQHGGKIEQNPLIYNNHPISNAFKINDNRNSSSVTQWDGDISHEIDKEQAIQLLRNTSLSPTMLETYATCPYRYFLRYRLGLAKLDSPEETPSQIDARDQGLLLHKIFERFHLAILENNENPKPEEMWTEKQRQLMRDITNQSFKEWENEGFIAQGIYWELDKDKILTLVEAYLNEDFRLRSQFLNSTSNVEHRFGFISDEDDNKDAWVAPEIEIPNIGTIKFRGIIDRIDSSSDKKQALILDLKTGSNIPYKELNKDIFSGGKKLQLPIYLLAANKNIPQTEAIAAYWMVGFKGQYKIFPDIPPTFQEIESDMNSIMEKIANGMVSGLFPANPGPNSSNCKFCDFDQICPKKREVFWENKRINDGRLSHYLSLVKEEQTEQ